VPFWGVLSLYFVFKFLLIDKQDEFQLVSFFLTLKKYQFITLGLLL